MEKTQEDSPFKAPQANLEQSEVLSGPFKLNILSPRGRLGRMRFFTFSYLLMLAFGILSAVIIPIAAIGTNPAISGIILIALISLFWMYLTTMLSVKRLHDINASGLWLLLPAGLIILAIIVAIIIGKTPGPGTAGVTTTLVATIYFLSCLIMGIVLIFFPGTKSQNRFGHPPPPNSTGVKIGFFIILALFALTIVNAILSGYQYTQHFNQGL